MAEGSGQATGTDRDATVRAAVRTPLYDLHKRSSAIIGGQTFFLPSGELFKLPEEKKERKRNGTSYIPLNAHFVDIDFTGGAPWRS